MLAHLAFQKPLGVADPVEAEMADIGFGGDESHGHLVADFSTAQFGVENEGIFVGGSVAGGALHRAGQNRPGIFAKFLKAAGVKNRSEEVMGRWLTMSKRVGKNPLGEWGRMDSPHVRIKNTRDFAYLTLKRHGSPMHFTEVAKGIKKLFKRETHPATTHNELIKDGRFVLVGRGLYALKEWGYEPGVVRDVVRGIIEREGPLTREEILDRVKRERYVKDATIAVNLQNPMFVRLSDGRYGLSKSR